MMENLPFREPPRPAPQQNRSQSIPRHEVLEGDEEWEYEYSTTETEVTRFLS